MKARGFAYKKPRGGFEPLEFDLAPGAGEAVVKVAGCGLCHTDAAFYFGEVAPRGALPLVLGHEVSGTVVAAGKGAESLEGRNVVVPAVLPCGSCDRCAAGFENTCARQFMPGNDGHGGFANLMKVPAAGVAALPADLGGYELHELSVVADAVTTPYQAVLRSGLGRGGFAVVVGVGGVGTYAVQIAAATGARVMALDVDDAKLERIRGHGADAVLNVAGLDAKSVRKIARSKAAELEVPDFAWKIFETSGTASGQELAYGLLTPAATLSVVGFSPQPLNLRLSNLMALDASAIGNWGCAPRHYPAVIDLVLKGRVDLRPFIRSYPLEQIEDLFEACHSGQLAARAILRPGES